jgi:hypothetical protein
MHFPLNWFAVIVLTLMVTVRPLSAAELTQSDSLEFQRIISSQIQAFRADDGFAAYSYAAPAIRKIFPSPEIFMQMVRNGYQPVYRPRSFAFGEITEEAPGRPTQRVAVVDANGKAWIALYAFEKQPDGSWKIIGCSLVESQGGEA